MKPRFDEAPVLVKALELERRLNDLAIHKAKCDCPEGKCDCEDCPKCGSKMNKMGCMKMGCGGKMAKAEPGFKAEKISDINPHMVTETGGQTRTAYYTTNGKTIESEDAKKKPKKKDATSLETLSSKLNPHSGTGVEREDTAGEKGL
jgi:hypothetical protein|tara:strand:+ start:1082 stop:1522 length:441 start_codon:yes stop_codon:yes gene_type:complete